MKGKKLRTEVKKSTQSTEQQFIIKEDTICVAKFAVPGRFKEFSFRNPEFKGEYITHDCCAQRTYSHESLMYLISDEARPANIKKSDWDNMSKKKRWQNQLLIDAQMYYPAHPFVTFELIN